MKRFEFTFSYKPHGGATELSAYDGAQALYGIARSLSITTHYVIHKRIIKQAPSLKGARILIAPPKAGSFEFIAPIIDLASSGSQPIVLTSMSGLSFNFLSDLTKLLYRRLSGLSEKPETDELDNLLRRKSGDVDSLADAIGEDIVRLHRPIDGNVDQFNVYDSIRPVGDFDRQTQDYAKTKVISDEEEEFTGNVSSFNANTKSGRFYIDDEERTVAFKIDRDTEIPSKKIKLLSWSLNEYANEREGALLLTGRALRSRQGLLKAIFITDISKI